MKIRLFIIYLVIVLPTVNLYALTVTVDFGDATINSVLKTPVENAITSAVSKYDYMPELTRAFGNANTYASHAATLRGYQGYDLFAISAGSMVSVQSPKDDPKFYKKIKDELDFGDLYAGVGGNPAVIQVGINLGFIIEDLYLSFKFGKFSYNVNTSDYKIDYKSNLSGLMLNYQLFKEKSILSRALLWRGISLGSGFIYSNNIVSFNKDLDLLTVTSGGYTALVDPSVDLVLDTKSIVVPVELYTSIRLFYLLSLGVGAGVDYVPYGKTNFKLKSAGSVLITAAPAGVGTVGATSIEANTNDIEPDKLRSKIMANIGIGIGPFFIDMPASYYFTDNGYAVGLSTGIVW